MRQFEILEPQTLEEALNLLDTDDPNVRPISGGTALMLLMKSKVFQPTALISLRRLKEGLKSIELGKEGELRIGAMTPLENLENSQLVRTFSPVITQSMKTLSNIRVRNVATIGGHIAHADPHMDLPPILLALNAKICVANSQGSRWVNIEDLFTGYYSTSLARNELITELVIPRIENGTQGSYMKCTALSADDWPMVGVAVFFRKENGKIADPKVTVSAATEKPIRIRKVESVLADQPLTDVLFQEAANLAASEVKPLADIRGSSAYKREMIRVYTKRALDTALQSIPHGGSRYNA